MKKVKVSELEKRMKWRFNKERLKNGDPEKYAWMVLRNNARRRGINFELSLDEFRMFCKKTDYIRKKGRKSESFAIDRINESDKNIGYRIDNIRVITNGDNVRKMLMLKYEWSEEKRSMVFWHCLSSSVVGGVEDVPF